MPIRFSCPACNKAMRIDGSRAREVIRCPGCGKKVRVPDQDDDDILEGVPRSLAPVQADRQQLPPVRTPVAAPDPAEESSDGSDDRGDGAPDSESPLGYDDPDISARPGVNPGVVAAGIAGAFVALAALGVCIVSASQHGNESPSPREPGARPASRPVAADRPSKDAEMADAVIGATSRAMLLWVVCIGPFALAFYVIPTVVAFIRDHKNKLAILALNLLLGWLFVGWVLALVWALTESRPPDQVHVHHYHPPSP